MWLSVALATDSEHADALSNALLDQGAITASIEDALAGTPGETPQFDEPDAGDSPQLWRNSRVIALFEPGVASGELDRRIAAACATADIGRLPAFTIEKIDEQNWVQLTQSQFAPIQINQRLWIVPSWHAARDPAAINLALDPGLAFGTGSHPTTRLCLEWLCQGIRGGETLLDYGCGSGILAIAAAKLGASRVLGVDIDASALRVAHDNASANKIALELRHSSANLAETFDLVIANILTNPLCLLAPLLSARVAAGDAKGKLPGRLALSGILASQAEQVIAAYAPFISLQVVATLEGWVLLEGRQTC